MNIKHFIEWFIPEELSRDHVTFGKAKITVVTMIVTSILLLPNVLRGLRIDRMDLAIVTFLASLAVGMGPFIFKVLRSQLIAGNYYLIIFASLTATVAVLRGGAASHFIANLAIVVMMSFLMTGLLNGISTLR